jgi:fructose-1,6-bisphosphatase/inositol monophosphatase family enzyme
MIPVRQIYDRVIQEVDDQLSEILKLRTTRVLKEDQSYVTQGDLMVQDILQRLLGEEVPGCRVISEEDYGNVVRPETADVFVVDPIDGTENFTSGLPEWGISISYYRSGTHTGSLLLCPEMRRSIQTGDVLPEPYQSRIRGLSSSLGIEELSRATQGFEYRVMGCCVYNMMNVITGAYLSFENPRGAKSWDILAGLNLAREHGLTVTVNEKEYSGEYLIHSEKYRFKIGR